MEPNTEKVRAHLNAAINHLVDAAVELEFGGWEKFEQYAEEEYPLVFDWEEEIGLFSEEMSRKQNSEGLVCTMS